MGRWGHAENFMCACLKEERGVRGRGGVGGSVSVVFVSSQTVSHLPYLWSLDSSLNWPDTELSVGLGGSSESHL